MCDELINLKLPVQVVIDEIGELSAAFDAAKSAALPHTTSDELEGYIDTRSAYK